MPDAEAQIAALQEQNKELSAKVDSLAIKVDQLVELFNAAKGVLAAFKFLCWISGIGATIYAVMHGNMPK